MGENFSIKNTDTNTDTTSSMGKLDSFSEFGLSTDPSKALLHATLAAYYALNSGSHQQAKELFMTLIAANYRTDLVYAGAALSMYLLGKSLEEINAAFPGWQTKSELTHVMFECLKSLPKGKLI